MQPLRMEEGKKPAASTPRAGLLEESRSAISLAFNVSAFVPVVVQQSAPSDEVSAKERQVLFNVEGEVSPGEILALMGPSGSGKSSLMAVLCGRSSARTEGHVLFNGQPMTKAVKRTLGFVTQDDLLFAELTTYETLYYAALLRLPREWTRDAKLDRVEAVLEGLGLARCRDTIIGDHMMRGVSGGERKRVSIGHELLINPSILLLDEPTSGLDSTTALNVMQTMRALASGGRTIIASIHQPSSRIYQEMDQLLLLSEGYTLFYGDAHAAAGWFGAHDAGVPFGVSVADHILDLACGDLPGRSSDDSKAVRLRLVDAWRERTIGRRSKGVMAQDVGVDGRPDGEEREGSNGTSSKEGSSASLGSAVVATTADGRPSVPPGAVLVTVDAVGAAKPQPAVSLPPETDRPEEDSKWGATWLQQVSILTSRCVRVRRLNSLSIQQIAQVVVPAILGGLFWFQLGGSETLTRQDVSDLSGLLFFEVLFNAYMTMFSAIFVFPSTFAMLRKERASGMYQLTSFYTAQSLSDIPMDLFIPSLFTIIVYWMAGLRISAGAFFANWMSTLLAVLVAQSTGLLLGATVMNPKTGMALATIYMLTIMLVAGYWVRNVPSWISWLKYASFIYHGYNLLLKIEFGQRGYSCTDYYAAHPDAEPGREWCPVSSGGQFDIDVDSPVTLEVLVLLGFLLAMRVGVYYALRQQTTFKGAK